MSSPLANVFPITHKIATLSDKHDDMMFLIHLLLEQIEQKISQQSKHKRAQYLTTLLVSLRTLLDNNIAKLIHDNINQILDNQQTTVVTNTDLLSMLPDDLYIKLGTFVTRNDSIQLRCVNKSLYIRSMSPKYIKNRQTSNEQVLKVNDFIFDQIHWNSQNSLIYQNPNAIQICGLPKNSIQWFYNHQNNKCWQSLFDRVNHLRVQGDNTIWQKIPVCKLFNAANNQNNINIDFCFGWDRNNVEMNSFECQYYQCLQNKYKMRHINTLTLIDVYQQPVLRSLIRTLNGNFDSLVLKHVKLSIGSNRQLNDVFHTNLKELEISHHCTICIDTNLSNDANLWAKQRKYKLNKINISQHGNWDTQNMKLMRTLTKFRILDNVTFLAIDWVMDDHNTDENVASLISYHGWLYQLLDSNKWSIHCPQLKIVQVFAEIERTTHFVQIIDEMMALRNVNKLHSTLQTITFAIQFVRFVWETQLKHCPTALIKDWNTIYPTTAYQLSQSFTTASIEKACNWLCQCHNLMNGTTEMKKIEFVNSVESY